jgi:CRP-like cAMP-binding protein
VRTSLVDDDVVLSAPLFADMESGESRALFDSMVPVDLVRGDVLFREGEPGDRLYVIASGKIKLGRRSADGRENLLSILGPGEMFSVEPAAGGVIWDADIKTQLATSAPYGERIAPSTCGPGRAAGRSLGRPAASSAPRARPSLVRAAGRPGAVRLRNPRLTT